MAFETGTATSSTDLWNKLIAFLTTDVDLTSIDEEWAVVWTHPSGATSGVVLRGPGAAGTDSIYVGLSLTTTLDTDGHYITIWGMLTPVLAATQMSEHIHVSPGVRVWLDANSMKYWLVGSGRRFMLAVNMSTVYEVAYAGFFLPYALPTEYPYPLFIGGTQSASSDVTSWRSTSDYHAAFPFAPYNDSGSAGVNKASAYLLDPNGAWLNACGDTDTGVDIAIGPHRYQNYDPDGGDDFSITASVFSPDALPGYSDVRSRIMLSYGDVFALDPITLIRTNEAIQMYGILDGFYVCPGVGQASENLIQIGGVDHIVVQNVFRTSTLSYMAIRLE